MFQFVLPKRRLAILLIVLVACLIGRTFVVSAQLVPYKGKKRTRVVSFSQIQVCKKIIEEQDKQQQAATVAPTPHVQASVIIFTYQADHALYACDDEKYHNASTPRAPPLFS